MSDTPISDNERQKIEAALTRCETAMKELQKTVGSLEKNAAQVIEQLRAERRAALKKDKP